MYQSGSPLGSVNEGGLCTPSIPPQVSQLGRQSSIDGDKALDMQYGGQLSSHHYQYTARPGHNQNRYLKQASLLSLAW